MQNIIQHFQENTDDEHEYYNIAGDQEDDDINFFEPSDQEHDKGNSKCIHIINKILKGTARLNALLPTATILVFSTFAPLITNDGKCTTFDRWLISSFTAILAISCVFFSITDTFRTSSGRLYYGVATFHGIRTFGRGPATPCEPSDYRLRWSDLFHASLALTAFLVFSLLHNDIVSCFHLVFLPRKLINLGPLVVLFVISLLFVLFPSTRRGIGYPFSL